MDKITIMQKQKDFFRLLYAPIILEGNNLANRENIILCYLDKNARTKENKTSIMRECKSFNNIDDLYLYINNNSKTKYCETYFSIYTSNSNDRTSENMTTACCIGLDYDKKNFNEKGIDLNIDYIQAELRKLGLFYNAIISSGNGYHVYILLEPTTNIDLVVKVTREIAKRTGADLDACKPTQILRVPHTYNNKQLSEGIRKPVTTIWLDNTPKRKNIEKLAKQLFNNSAIEGTIRSLKINNSCQKLNDLLEKPCVDSISRHEEFLFLQGKLLQLNVSQGQFKLALDKFQELNKLEDFETQVKWFEKKGRPVSSCKNCNYINECYKYEELKEQLETDLLFNNKILKKASKKGAKANMLKGNELLVYGIIYIQQNITIEGLIKEFTTKNRKTKEVKQCLSERTIKSCLKNMENKGIIMVAKEGRKNIYSIKTPKRLLEDQKILLSSGALYERIKGNISEAEFQLYCFMKYLQWEQRSLNRINSNFKLKITQKEIAKEYGISVTECNKHIQGLIEGKYISIADTHKSEKNGYNYYTYTLNY